MSNEIQIFNSAEFGSLTILDIDGKPWFIGNEVATMLGYSNPRDALSKHCRGVAKRDIPSTSGIQQMNIIPEGDVYRLIARSKLPAAEKFESWVFDEVLPSIRKTGMYATAPTIESILANPDMFITLLQQYKEEHTERVRLEAINHQQAIENEALLDENTRLNDRLGFGETWKQVPAIPYFNKYFDMRQNAVWRQLGVALTRLSNELGYDTMRVPDTRFPDGVKCYHVDVEAEVKRGLGVEKLF
mgnify:CR=1 FL=1